MTAQKIQALRELLYRLAIDLENVEEAFIRSGGPGGQKVNKTSSGVALRYQPLGIMVKWTRERSQALNRFLALRELAAEAEAIVSPGTSPRAKEQAKVKKQKDRRRRRGPAGGGSPKPE